MIRFDDRFVRSLPADPEPGNFVRPVRAAYSRVTPAKVQKPTVLAWSKSVASMLGLPEAPTSEWEQVLAGNAVLDGMQPYAACYGGHQFGNWAGQLGDGRAITLGELIAPDDSRWEVQLKGPGQTPYSRRADGRAVLRSSLREYVCSEAMHHLGVPTTRALALVSTGELVERDLLYDGHVRAEPGAITTRVAPSFLRFGSFELPASRGERDLLRSLVDYTLRTFFPSLGPLTPSSVMALFREVSRRTTKLVMEWQRVGFVHGVMNTDNMSMLGLTIDYGPYGWLEGFDPTWTPNTTDLPGRRYCFGNQPTVAQWNLMCLANALYPLVEDDAPFEEALDDYPAQAGALQLEMMQAKLGLVASADSTTIDRELMRDLFRVWMTTETDVTLFFRQLATLSPSMKSLGDEDLLRPLAESFYVPAELTGEVLHGFAQWTRRWLERVERDGRTDEVRRAAMNSVNPLYVPRNYLAQTVIQAVEQGDVALLAEWMRVLERPYEEQPGMEKWARKRPEWARHQPGSSMLSCSS